MPVVLVKAHCELDRTVDRCYRAAPFRTDKEHLEFLIERYEELTRIFIGFRSEAS